MAEAKTVSDIMREGAAKYTGGNVICERAIYAKPLEPSGYLSFCPRCAVTNARRFGKEWMQNMKPLLFVRVKMLLRVSEERGRVCYESRWQCPECRSWITEEDFVKAYCEPRRTAPDFLDLTKVDLSDPNFSRYF